MMIKCKKRMGAVAIMILLACLATTSLLAAEQMADVDISYWVRDSLRIDPRVDASKIGVASEQGIVTLSGSVDNLAAKQYANLEAKKINGVLGVINEIVVMPVWRSDTDIRHAVKRRILDSAVISSEGIRVATKNGRVTLSGEVSNWGEAQQAGLLASEVRGVSQVKNDLVAAWQIKRSDSAIKKDAIAALQRDVYLSSLPIVVSVNDGIVNLTGSVGSVFESDRAMQKVRLISNVKGVVSDLRVEGWENRGARKEKVWPSDDALKRAVWAELNQDPYVVATDITVRASLGSITLDGTVNSYYQALIAGQDANNVVGVGWVVNNLLVAGTSRSDWLIEDDVAFNFNTDYVLEGFQLKSKVKNGVVSLTGEVNNSFEKYHAGNVAADVLGVKQVINRIAVLRTRMKSDQALTDDVINNLRWNWTTRPVLNDIKVSTINGIATLKGEVDSGSERREAGRVAFRTAGIWAVDNQLTVTSYGANYPWDQWFDKSIPGQWDPTYYPDHMWKYYEHPYLWDNS